MNFIFFDLLLSPTVSASSSAHVAKSKKIHSVFFLRSLVKFLAKIRVHSSTKLVTQLEVIVGYRAVLLMREKEGFFFSRGHCWPS